MCLWKVSIWIFKFFNILKGKDIYDIMITSLFYYQNNLDYYSSHRLIHISIHLLPIPLLMTVLQLNAILDNLRAKQLSNKRFCNLEPFS